MNIEGLEIRVNKQYGTVTYWKGEMLVGRKCTKCGKNKLISEFNFQNKSKGTYQPKCRECGKKHSKKWRENNFDYRKEYSERWRKNNPDYYKRYNQDNKEHLKEYRQQWNQNNKEHRKEQSKQYYQSNKEHKREYSKRYNQNRQENNLRYISNIVEQINPVFKQLNLPIYGYVYMFENVKTGHRYLGQSIKPIKERYKSNIIQGWIKERLDKSSQKFTEELIEEDIKLTEVLDVAFCQYHLDKLEAYYIDKYDSCNNGYNNNAGYWNRDDGLDEFNEILKTYNLQFIDGKIIKAPTQK